MASNLIFRSKLIYPDGAIREMVFWKLPRPTHDRLHGLKYRLYYGSAEGVCLIRYDNEKGKCDHRHIGRQEAPCLFKNVETLVEDFLTDIAEIRGGIK